MSIDDYQAAARIDPLQELPRFAIRVRNLQLANHNKDVGLYSVGAQQRRRAFSPAHNLMTRFVQKIIEGLRAGRARIKGRAIGRAFRIRNVFDAHVRSGVERDQYDHYYDQSDD